MSASTELTQLHTQADAVRRCVAALANSAGDSPPIRRLVNDAQRILNDVARLDIDTEELSNEQPQPKPTASTKIAIPDTPYAQDFWSDAPDEGLGGQTDRH